MCHSGKSSITMTVSPWEIQYNHEAGSCSLSVTAALCQKAVDVKTFFFLKILSIKNTLRPSNSWRRSFPLVEGKTPPQRHQCKLVWIKVFHIISSMYEYWYRSCFLVHFFPLCVLISRLSSVRVKTIENIYGIVPGNPVLYLLARTETTPSNIGGRVFIITSKMPRCLDSPC